VAPVTVIVILLPAAVGVELLTRSVTDPPPGAIVGVVLRNELSGPWVAEKEAPVNVPAGPVSVIVCGKISWPVELALNPTL
jgi:hypothetical protein